MRSVNSILSPSDYTWDMPSLSDGLAPGNTGAYTSGPQQSNAFETFHTFHPATFSSPPHANTFSNEDHPYDSQDVTMAEESDAQRHLQHSAGPPSPPVFTTRREKYGNIDWETHKQEIKRLYLDGKGNGNLEETMRIMKEKHSIPDSKKLYKEKFKAWGWQKNLPGKYAHWMTQKANKRMRDDGKETIFLYGGLQWDKSEAEKRATRSKKARTEAEVIVVDTPNDIDYKTPKDAPVSPRSTRSPGGPGSRIARQRAVLGTIETESESEDRVPELPLNWRGHSRSELVAMFNAARSHASHTETERSEAMFLKALEGYEYLLGPTHEDTTKVAFALASFYSEQGRNTDADRIIEDACGHYIARFGVEDRHSQQLVLQVVELLNGWNRQHDALAFLARSKELSEIGTDVASSSTTRGTKTRRQGKKSQRHAATPLNTLPDIAEDMIAGADPAQIDYGIEVARTRVAAKDEAVETFLRTIISLCGRDHGTFELQDLRARSELLKLYNKLGQSISQTGAFMSAVAIAEAVTGRRKWDKEHFKSFEVMEAVLGLTACLLNGGYQNEAFRIFTNVEHKAEDEFGWDQERTIWAKITIGLVYQKYKGWDSAKDWFQHAYAASWAANGDEDGITRSLQAAMEKSHFSYVSDEGRPFKTIFGVSGIAIRPNRLHLD